MTIHPTRAIRIATVIAFASLLNACASLAPADQSAGYIAEVDTSHIRMCFRSGMSPPAGQEVHFMSNAQIPRPSYRSMRAVGAARIIAAGSDGCATAIVLGGSPQRDDEVYLSDAGRANRSAAE